MTISLGDLLLPAINDVSFALAPGVAPSECEIELPTAVAKKAFDESGGVGRTLRIGADSWENIYLISLGPGSRPQTRTIVLADVRYLLPYLSLVLDYNLRQRTGIIRLIGEGRLDQLQPAPEVSYRASSLNNGAPWTTQQAIEDALFRVAAGLAINKLGNITVGGGVQIIEDFSEAGPADEVLARLLGKVPGFTLTVFRDGSLGVTDTQSDIETGAELEKIATTFQTGGWIETVDRRYLRYPEVRVHFVREQELRFDHDEDVDEALGLRPQTVSAGANQVPPRRLFQVVEVPVRTLLVDGRQLGEGTLLRLATLFRALPQQTAPELQLSDIAGTFRGPLSFAVMREGHLSDHQFFQHYYTNGNGGFLGSWYQIIREVQASFRRNFQIEPAWRDRIRRFEARRVALYDPITKSFGDSRAYTDVTFIPSNRVLVTGKDISLIRQAEGWIVRGYATTLASAKSVSAFVSLRDQEAGVVRVSYKTGHHDEENRIIPGILKRLPVIADFGNLASLAIGDQYEGELESGWKLALIVTAVQSAPNGLGRYHTEVVAPGDVASLLGLTSLGPCEGRPLDIIIGESPTTTARFAWSDDFATEIEEAFISGTTSPPKTLLVNKDIVEAIAKGAAAAAYSRVLDTLGGSVDYPSGAGVEARGRIAAVGVSRTQQRGAISTVRLSGKIGAGDFAPYLPQAIQRRVFGTVQQ